MKTSRLTAALSKITTIFLLIVGSLGLSSCTKRCALRLDEHISKPDPAPNSNSPKPELVVRRGHVGEIHDVAVSLDGKLFASGGEDYQVKLWDIETGRMLRTLIGHENEVQSLQFSPSGNFLITSDKDPTYILWNVQTGEKIKQISNVNGFTEFSPDEQLIAYRDQDTTESDTEFLRVISLPSGKLIHNFKVLADFFLPKAFSPENTLISVEKDGGTSLFNINKAEFAPQKFFGNFLAFLPDGAVLTFTESGSQRFTKNAEQVGEEEPQEGTVRCGILGKTEERFRVTGVIADSFRRPVISSDGRMVAGWVSPNSVSLWSTQNGKLLRTLKVSRSAAELEFSPDGNVLILQDSGITKSFDTRTGKLLAKFKSPSFFGFSRDSSMVAVFKEEKSELLLQVLDVRTAGVTISRRFDQAPSEKPAISFSNDWKSLTMKQGENAVTIGQTKRLNLNDFSSTSSVILREHSGTIEFYDRKSDSVVRTLSISDSSYKISADRHRIAIGMSTDKDVTEVWDVENNRLLRSLPGMLRGITPSGKVVVTTVYSLGKAITKLWDSETGLSLGRIDGVNIEIIAFSPDSKLIALSQDGNGTRAARHISISSAETGADITDIEGDANYSAEFSFDSQTVAIGGYYGTVQLCNARTGTVIRQFQDVGSSTPVAFSPNGRTLATYNSESGVRLWAIETGELLGSVVQFDGTNWLAVTPDGLFDGTPTAWSQILWRFSHDTLNVLPVETFFSDFYSPGLVTDLLAGYKPVAPRNIADLDRRLTHLALKVTGQDASQPIASRAVNVQIQITEAPAGVRDLRLFRNGTLVKTWRGELLLVNGQGVLEANITLVAGENRLTAYAFNKDNVKSLDATLVCIGADVLKRKPSAYIFAIGVNDYSNPELNLKYAKADALVFSEELSRRQLNLNQFDQIKVVSLLDQDSTKANVLAGLNRLSSTPSQLGQDSSATTLNELQAAQPEDTIIIYFAGHGTAFRDQFYLVPSDINYTGGRQEIGDENIACILNRSISDRELEVAFEGVEARNILMVIDSCNSGQMLEAEEKRRGPMNSKGLAQLAYEKGMFILTAAQSYQAALEADKLGHGFLTFALVLEGLKSLRADFDPKDGEITAREWLDYAAERVPQLQAEKMQQARSLNHDVAFVTGEEGETDLRKRNVQVPRVFYRREIEPNQFIIAK